MPTACAKRPKPTSALPEVVIQSPSFVQPACRSSWSGSLKLGAISVPLKGYSAAVTQRDSPLHLVHAECGNRIQQPRRCPKHGEIPSEQIVKAFEFAPDEDIVLTDNELSQLKPDDDQTIHIERLLLARRLDLFVLSGRTLLLVPAHAAATDAYQLVVTALARSEECGIGRVVMSERRQLIALRIVEQRLVLHVLHWPAQWRACPSFETPKPQALADVERLSASLVPLRKPFEWSEFHDDFDQMLTDLVRRKMTATKRTPAVVAAAESTQRPNARRTTTPRGGRAV